MSLPRKKIRRQAFLSIKLCFFSKEERGEVWRGGTVEHSQKPKEFIAFWLPCSPGLWGGLDLRQRGKTQCFGMVQKSNEFLRFYTNPPPLAANPGGALTI